MVERSREREAARNVRAGAVASLDAVSLTPVVTVQLYERICDRIVEAIRKGRWQPGERLPNEHELAQALGVSRPSLREALGALQILGVLDTKHGAGTWVAANAIEIVAQNPPANLLGVDSDVSPVAVLEARLTIEPPIAGLAALAHKADPRMEQLLGMMDRARDFANPAHRAVWSDADRLFHRQLAAQTDNPVFLAFAEHLAFVQSQPLWRRLRDQMLMEPGRVEASIAEHERIHDAIVRGDADGARAAARDHVCTVRELMGLTEAQRATGSR
jgi:DNA-binding FadR family transcriptional regulator